MEEQIMKKSIIKRIMILVLFIVSSYYAVFAQSQTENEEQAPKKSKKRVGLSASISNSNMDKVDIMVPYWIRRKMIIAPTFGLEYIQSQSIEFRIGVVFRFIKKLKRLSPYYGLRTGIMTLNMEGGSNSVDSYLGFLYGGEFFLTKQFSVGLEAQANIYKSSANSTRFNNPDGINFMTSSVIMVSIYF